MFYFIKDFNCSAYSGDRSLSTVSQFIPEKQLCHCRDPEPSGTGGGSGLDCELGKNHIGSVWFLTESVRQLLCTDVLK